MQQHDNALTELVAAEKAAKEEWHRAVQAANAANEQVGKAHSRWLATQKALEKATNQPEKPRVHAAAAG